MRCVSLIATPFNCHKFAYILEHNQGYSGHSVSLPSMLAWFALVAIFACIVVCLKTRNPTALLRRCATVPWSCGLLLCCQPTDLLWPFQRMKLNSSHVVLSWATLTDKAWIASYFAGLSRLVSSHVWLHLPLNPPRLFLEMSSVYSKPGCPGFQIVEVGRGVIETGDKFLRVK